jgi:hypothetical protein
MDQSNPKNYLSSEENYFASMEGYFEKSSGSFSEKAHAFPRFVSRQSINYFLARNEIFKKILNVHGSVLDFGIYRGSSFFTWLQLSASYEPYNHIRKIIGFDSFKGFSEIGEKDQSSHDDNLSLKNQGGMAFNGHQEMVDGIDLYDLNRPLGHIEKGIIVKNTLPQGCSKYLEQHQETIVSLANFGLGLYEPTVEILKLIKPRLVKGSIIVFEDLNQATWPGETNAFMEVFAPGEVSLNRTVFCPHISWITIGG